MSNGVLLLVSGLAVVGNVGLLWLTLAIGRRSTTEFDNTRSTRVQPILPATTRRAPPVRLVNISANWAKIPR
jgi:hypothetical protein